MSSLRSQTTRETCSTVPPAKTDSLRLARKMLNAAYAEGYFEAALVPGPDRSICLKKGEKYAVVRLNAPGLAAAAPLSPATLILSADSWLLQMENRGYPFATMSFSADSIHEREIFISSLPDPGPFCTYDSFDFRALRPGEGFLKRAAGIRKGEPYRHVHVQTLRNRLAAIPGYLPVAPVDLYFSEQRFVVSPGITRSAKDRLSALVGLATDPGRRPVFTGEADFCFYDLFGGGVQLYGTWRSFRARSQELLAGGSWPFPLGLPFIISGKLAFDKYDTIYSRLRNGLSFRMPAGKMFRIEFGGDITTISRIWANEEAVRTGRRLPDNPNSRNSMFFLTGEYGHDQAGILPVRGVFARISAGAGSRTLLRDARLENISWISSSGIRENIYDSLERTTGLRQNQFQYDYRVESYSPLKPWLILALKLRGQELRSGRIFFSELQRWGGINDLRGFNEQSIFANRFHMMTAEFRLTAVNTGYLAPFASGAWFADDAARTEGYAISAGLVSGIRTGAGILKLAWAVGGVNGSAWSFASSRIHVGISNSF